MTGSVSSKRRDVVVIGGGPGGTTAARQLVRFGYDTLLLDKATFPRHKTCGGLLTDKTLRLLDRVFGESFQSLQDRGIINHHSSRYEAWIEDQRVVEGRLDDRFCFVDRREYDHYLLGEASRSGVEVCEGEGVTGVDFEANEVRTEAGRTIPARAIVAADGAHSPVRKQLIRENKLDTSEPEWLENLAMALEAYVPRDEVSLDVDRPVLHLGFVNWGYAWVFPHRDRYLIGLGGLRSENDNFRESLLEYLSFLGVPKTACEMKGHPIPYGNYLSEPVHRQTLLVGDAAGLVDPLTAEGIFYAQRSGELAAYAFHRHAAEETPVADAYARLLKNHVLPELKGARALRPLFFYGPALLRHPVLKRGLSLLSSQLVDVFQGHRIYGGLRSKGKERHDTVTDGAA